MAYLDVPDELTSAPGTPAAEAAAASLLRDIAGRREFRVFRSADAPGEAPGDAPGEAPGEALDVYGFAIDRRGLAIPGLRLTGAQQFVRNLVNPHTPYTRLLADWRTGSGKSLLILAIATEFVRQFRSRAAVGERVPQVFIVSFTARETVMEELLRHPEFGIVSRAEAAELRRLRIAAANSLGTGSSEIRMLSGYLSVLRRRVTDRGRGGAYQFYGYKEFANRLIAVTAQGAARKFDVLELYSRSSADFGVRLRDAVRAGDAVVDETLLAELRGGLIFADEIHDVYNIHEKNNYGIAIQYALDSLGDDAPRAVFTTATPMTGSAAEIVDLLNLLVPRDLLPKGEPLEREDFFVAGDEGALALRPGSLAKIAHLAAGRTSYLLEADGASFPKRKFVGEPIPGVPYLLFTCCPMSPFHARTVVSATAGRDAGLAANAHTLFDMVFPNPDAPPDAAVDPASTAVGSYISHETVARLASAPEAWRNEVGVEIEADENDRLPPRVSGAFLGPGRLAAYSAKYAKLVEDVLAAIRAGPGPMMIYHHRVRMSGVVLIQEVLRAHGILDETSSATDFTVCAVCGSVRLDHRAEHAFAPARFVVAHSDIDRGAMARSISRFNAHSNLDGHEYRILLGSQIVSQSYNFRAVRNMFVVSFPIDFPTLIQVFGRVARKNSHVDLPPDQRNVTIRVYISTFASSLGVSPGASPGVSPEVRRYTIKGREYLLIQEVGRALHAYAVDGFANFDRIHAALSAPAAGLEAMSYEPVVGPRDADKISCRSASFLAYGHGDREVATIAAVCRVLFRARPVWTLADLWAAVRSGKVSNANYDPSAFDHGNFLLAVDSLRRPAGDPPAVVVPVGRFLVAALSGSNGRPIIDVESYLRDHALSDAAEPAGNRVVVKIADFMKLGRDIENFAVRIRDFNRDYVLASKNDAHLSRSLLDCGPGFHSELLRRLTEAGASEQVTADDRRVREMYRRFKIAVLAGDASSPAAQRVFRGGRRGGKADEFVGFVAADSVSLFDFAERRWYAASHADFAISRRHTENNIAVGISAGDRCRVKLRMPIQMLRRAEGKDVRSVARGAVCETFARPTLDAIARGLVRAGRDLPDKWRPAPSGSADLSTTGLCSEIRDYLLALEARARAPADGMASGVRWLYLMFDRPPSVASVA